MKREGVAVAVAVASNSVEKDEKISHAFAFEDLTDKENPDFRYVL